MFEEILKQGWMWWAFALLLFSIELLTGSFYLLALAAAAAAGGAVYALGGGFGLQTAIAGLVGAVGCFAAYWKHQKGPSKPTRPVPLDVGQKVKILEWRDDGTARVFYRGSQWEGMVATQDTPRHDSMVIIDTRGSSLVLSVGFVGQETQLSRLGEKDA